MFDHYDGGLNIMSHGGFLTLISVADPDSFVLDPDPDPDPAWI